MRVVTIIAVFILITTAATIHWYCWVLFIIGLLWAAIFDVLNITPGGMTEQINAGRKAMFTK